MPNNSEFNANGQLLFIEPTWITGETCLFTITDPYDYIRAKIKVSRDRREFVSRLQREGFVITTDKFNTEDDIIYLIMNNQAIAQGVPDPKEYKREFDRIMFASGGEKLNYPYSLSVEDYFKNPFLPAVFKNEETNGGKDKFLIETEEQIETIKRLYQDLSLNPQTANLFNNCIFQQLIETPTKYQTYMRVLMAASGDVLGATLRYSRVSETRREPNGIFEQFFWDEQSEYFMDCKGMFNYYSSGDSISFTQPRYSYEKQSILKEHGIDPNNPTIPEDVLEVATSIATKCNRELGIMCGIDFIFNKNDNKWYYLEIQSFPAIEEWATTKNIRIPTKHDVNNYIKYLAIELETRHDALMLYMQKKQTKSKRRVKKEL